METRLLELREGLHLKVMNQKLLRQILIHEVTVALPATSTLYSRDATSVPGHLTYSASLTTIARHLHISIRKT